MIRWFVNPIWNNKNKNNNKNKKSLLMCSWSVIDTHSLLVMVRENKKERILTKILLLLDGYLLWPQMPPSLFSFSHRKRRISSALSFLFWSRFLTTKSWQRTEQHRTWKVSRERPMVPIRSILWTCALLFQQTAPQAFKSGAGTSTDCWVYTHEASQDRFSLHVALMSPSCWRGTKRHLSGYKKVPWRIYPTLSTVTLLLSVSHQDQAINRKWASSCIPNFFHHTKIVGRQVRVCDCAK